MGVLAFPELMYDRAVFFIHTHIGGCIFSKSRHWPPAAGPRLVSSRLSTNNMFLKFEVDVVSLGLPALSLGCQAGKGNFMFVYDRCQADTLLTICPSNLRKMLLVWACQL